VTNSPLTRRSGGSMVMSRRCREALCAIDDVTSATFFATKRCKGNKATQICSRLSCGYYIQCLEEEEGGLVYDTERGSKRAACRCLKRQHTASYRVSVLLPKGCWLQARRAPTKRRRMRREAHEEEKNVIDSPQNLSFLAVSTPTCRGPRVSSCLAECR
jgi:hypothetical protein